MPTSKSRTNLWTSQVLTAGAGNTNSAWVDLSAAYGAQLDMFLTNGGTGPTVAAQFQVQVAADYNAGAPTKPTNFGGPLVGVVTNSGVTYFSVEIPIGVAAVRVVAGSNTGQNVTADADISVVTGI